MTLRLYSWFSFCNSINRCVKLVCQKNDTKAAQPPKQDPQTPAIAPSEDEEKERVTAERFLDVLVKRPTTGTALDKVFGYHLSKGDLGEVVKRLSEKLLSTR